MVALTLTLTLVLALCMLFVYIRFMVLLHIKNESRDPNGFFDLLLMLSPYVFYKDMNYWK